MKFSLQRKGRWFWVILAGLVLLFFFQYNSQLWNKAIQIYDLLHNHQQLKITILSYGPYSPLAYILLQVAQVVIAPVPGGAVEFLGGYLFGEWAGFSYSMIGLVLGSWLAFSLARAFEKYAVEKFVSTKNIKKFGYLMGHEGVIVSFLLFLIPGFPKDALCYLLGLTPMHTGIFLLISTVGRVPGTLMAVLQGGTACDHQYKLFLILLGISFLILLLFYIYHNEIHQWVKKLRKIKS
ncbi:MAG: TVP38/TMEM64 family protein [Thermodesulfobacteriota bacterium]